MITTNTPVGRPTKNKTLTTHDLPNAEKKPAPVAGKRQLIIQTGDFDGAGKYKYAAPEPVKENDDEHNS